MERPVLTGGLTIGALPSSRLRPSGKEISAVLNPLKLLDLGRLVPDFGRKLDRGIGAEGFRSAEAGFFSASGELLPGTAETGLAAVALGDRPRGIGLFGDPAGPG
jgi:hypothetical protein